MSATDLTPAERITVTRRTAYQAHQAWKQKQATRQPRTGTPGPRIRLEDVLDDVRLLAVTGSILETAAHRLGYRTPGALERALRRHGHHRLLHQFVYNAHKEVTW